MTDVDVRTRREAEAENSAITESAAPTPPRIAPGRGLRIFPLLITLVVVAVGELLNDAGRNAIPLAPAPRRMSA